MTSSPDIKPGLTHEQWLTSCFRYAEDAFYTPPEQFRFHHYDEPDNILICHRPMPGLEKYQVEDGKGGFYGLYNTRTVTYYLKSGTWVEVESEKFFKEHKIKQLQRELDDLISTL